MNVKKTYPAGVDILLTDRIEQELRKDLVARHGIPGARLPKQHALADKYGVSVKTIRQALSRLKRDNLIQSTRGRGTFLVPEKKKTANVLVFCDNPHHIYTIVGSGVISSVLKERGCRPNLVVSKHPEEEWDTLVPDRNEVAGGILIGSYTRKIVSDLVEKSKMPLVYVGDMNETIWGSALCDNVLPDNRALAYRATECLIRRGHRRIVLLQWDFSHAWERNAIQGYQDALAGYDIPYDPDLLVKFPPYPFTQDGDGKICLPQDETRQRIDRWFKTGQAPTAVIHQSGPELEIRDVLHYYFHDHFKPDSVLAMGYLDVFQTIYRGFGPADAVCMKLQNLAERAVELLFRDREKDAAPIRETQERLYLYQRRNGVWEEKKFEEII